MSETLRTFTDLLAPQQGEAVGLSGQRARLAKHDVRLARERLTRFRAKGGQKWFEHRREEIPALEHKLWHGRIVWRLHCYRCDTDRWVSEHILWSLIDLNHFCCPWCLLKG